MATMVYASVFLPGKHRGMRWMTKWAAGLLLTTVCCSNALAQCSICTKTAQQLGKESAEGLNTGIVYLMLLPFAIGGFIVWKWWKNEKSFGSDTAK